MKIKSHSYQIVRLEWKFLSITVTSSMILHTVGNIHSVLTELGELVFSKRCVRVARLLEMCLVDLRSVFSISSKSSLSCKLH